MCLIVIISVLINYFDHCAPRDSRKTTLTESLLFFSLTSLIIYICALAAAAAWQFMLRFKWRHNIIHIRRKMNIIYKEGALSLTQRRQKVTKETLKIVNRQQVSHAIKLTVAWRHHMQHGWLIGWFGSRLRLLRRCNSDSCDRASNNILIRFKYATALNFGFYFGREFIFGIFSLRGAAFLWWWRGLVAAGWLAVVVYIGLFSQHTNCNRSRLMMMMILLMHVNSNKIWIRVLFIHRIGKGWDS